ncbi:hypothetical protein KP509_39G041300 [Ceratopteris richardii]|uniref:VQ domain-containing protein n=1 Tax=Ceratopteris richardii TaxID=49495 RepID=A0A8T2Q080_CERRI|nr:hypothetical protein KP509_39G041300 [Ceratopteris richardii]
MGKFKRRDKLPPVRACWQGSGDGGRSSDMTGPPRFRQPIIIQTFSPEIIQTNAYDFMSLVQRLTGNGTYVSPPAKRARLQHSEVSSMSELSAPAGVVFRSSSHLASPRLPRQLSDTSLCFSASNVSGNWHNTGAPGGSVTPSLHRSTLEMTLGLPQGRPSSELASRRGLSPRLQLQLHMQTEFSPRSRSGMAAMASTKSPTSFEFSPSMLLPTPTNFLSDLPSLSSSEYKESRQVISPQQMTDLRGPGARSPLGKSPLGNKKRLQPDCVSRLASRRGLSPQVRLLLHQKEDSSPSGRIGEGILCSSRSPTYFEFSPSFTLPTPTLFLRDLPNLPSEESCEGRNQTLRVQEVIHSQSPRPPPQRSLCGTEQRPQTGRVSALAARRGLRSRASLQLQVQGASSPHNKEDAWSILPAKSPLFELSPTVLMSTPTAFLRDLPRLPSPYARTPTPLSGRLANKQAGRDILKTPETFPSPGPLTRAFFTDLANISPMAQDLRFSSSSF